MVDQKERKLNSDDAVSHASLEQIAGLTPEAFVAQLRHRGISSLEDLAKVSIGTAKAALAGGLVALDPEDVPVCYKFTQRPFSKGEIEDLVKGAIKR
jgi:hypothetical protein